LRWLLVVALSWLLIPVALGAPAPERAATIVGLAGLIGAVILIPVRWFVRIGGRQPTWEMRRAKVEVAQIANRVRRNPSAVPAARIQDAIVRIETLRTAEMSELCDLLIAELKDFLAGSESWNEAGRRSIRIDRICRELWPDDMPPPDFDRIEATFRWDLYRTFGKMMEAAVPGSSTYDVDAFTTLRDSLEEFRRGDTYRFIDAVQQSSDRWLARPGGERPWIESFDFAALGPEGLSEVRRIWGREAAMWGAELDDEDMRALQADLASRAVPAEPKPKPEPDSAATPAPAAIPVLEPGAATTAAAASQPQTSPVLDPDAERVAAGVDGAR
jgi:hypothetical protein